MGPSGSGKTTLLDLLAGRKNAGVCEGTMLFGSQVHLAGVAARGCLHACMGTMLICSWVRPAVMAVCGSMRVRVSVCTKLSAARCV